MNKTMQKNTDFINIYNKSYRLAAAAFTISNVIDQSEELKTKIKKLSLDIVSATVNLKDINFSDAKKLMEDVEKNSLLLMSMLDIASITGLISAMNGNIIKEEFQSFILELGKFADKFEDHNNVSVRGIFAESAVSNIDGNLSDDFKKLGTAQNLGSNSSYQNDQKSVACGEGKNGNGHKRKDLRKNTILDFIKRHNNVSIKDIAPNIIGCSEKTIQRELIELISKGKITKAGERRWSRYSIA